MGIDQYVTADEGAHHDLLKDLYQKFRLPHPGKVFYCFAVRVIIGAPLHTLDGKKEMSTGQPLWMNGETRRILSTAPGTNPPTHFHTLVAETGGKIKRHREFVIFDKERTKLEYLIA